MLADLAPPPPRLSATDSLFLDFDGTLVDLADNPEGVHVSQELADRLDALAAHMPGRLAIVSGRSIAQLDALFGPQAEHFTLAGSHGAERRSPEDGHDQPEKPAHLATATDEMRAVAEANDLYFETKSFGAGLHYRRNPDAEPLALRERRRKSLPRRNVEVQLAHILPVVVTGGHTTQVVVGNTRV